MKLRLLLILFISAFSYQFANAQCNAKFSYSIDTTTNTVSFYDSSNNQRVSHKWTVGNIVKYTANPKIQFLYAGKYNVCHIVTDSTCADTVCVTINIKNSIKCKADFSASTNGGGKYKFSNNGVGKQFYWTFGDGGTTTNSQPNHTYKKNGTYTVCMTATDSINNCYDRLCKTIKVTGASGGNCSALFSYSNRNDTFYFSAKNTAYTSYSWSVSNGHKSTNTSTSTVFSKSGSYTVCLEVYDSSNNCRDSICKTIYYTKSSKCKASFQTRISNDTAYFTNKSQNGNGSNNGLNYYWSFGDNSTSTKQHPIHVYGKSGFYYACLTVYDSSRTCQASYCDSVWVKSSNPCDASFSYSIDSNGRVSVSAKNRTYTTYYWNFGDGSSSSNQYDTHTYAKSGYYTICLGVYDSSKNCQDSFCKTIYVYKGGGSSCKASFTTKISQSTVAFKNTSTNGNQSRHGLFYYWSFGDNSTSNKEHPTHTYSRSGYYYPCLTIYDSTRNCQSTYCDSIAINNSNACDASFSYSIDSNGTVKVTAKNRNYTSYYWNFGDGSSSTNAIDTHTYSSGGYKTICLGVYDSIKNCQDSFCKTIYIQGNNTQKCKAEFKYKVSQNTVVFTNASKNTSGTKTGMSYTWTFGDGNTSSSKNPTHTYQKSGSYYACLVIYDSVGRCQSRYCDSVTVKGSCYASFNVVLDSTTKYKLRLINRSSKKSTHSYSWTFGDGGTSNVRNPKHTYQAYGWYQICLTISDSTLGCTSTFCDSIGMDSTGKMLKNGAFELVSEDEGSLGAEHQDKIDFTIYPNPADDIVYIQLKHLSPGTNGYEVVDLLGRVVAKQEIKNLETEIRVSSFKPGIYWVRIQQNEKVSIKKVMINH